MKYLQFETKTNLRSIRLLQQQTPKFQGNHLRHTTLLASTTFQEPLMKSNSTCGRDAEEDASMIVDCS